MSTWNGKAWVDGPTSTTPAAPAAPSGPPASFATVDEASEYASNQLVALGLPATFAAVRERVQDNAIPVVPVADRVAPGAPAGAKPVPASAVVSSTGPAGAPSGSVPTNTAPIDIAWIRAQLESQGFTVVPQV